MNSARCKGAPPPGEWPGVQGGIWGVCVCARLTHMTACVPARQRRRGARITLAWGAMMPRLQKGCPMMRRLEASADGAPDAAAAPAAPQGAHQNAPAPGQYAAHLYPFRVINAPKMGESMPGAPGGLPGGVGGASLSCSVWPSARGGMLLCPIRAYRIIESVHPWRFDMYRGEIYTSVLYD